MIYILTIVTILSVGGVYSMYNLKNKQAERVEGTKGFNFIDELIREHEEHQDMLSQRALTNGDRIHQRVYDIRITQFSTPFQKDEDVYHFVAPQIVTKIVRDYLGIMCKRNGWSFKVTENEFEGVIVEINTYVSCAIC